MENELPNPRRVPETTDLIALCRALNEAQAQYLVIGGFAINYHGYIRATEDIDLLVASDLENQRRTKQALEILPDQAIRELGDEDFRDYIVVRVADEILVDIMTLACGVDFEEARAGIEWANLEGVMIPFATPELLLRLKQTVRESDVSDRIFLHRLLAEKESKPS